MLNFTYGDAVGGAAHIATKEPFNILNFSFRLDILKEETTQLVCKCPVCGGGRLTINKKTGAYTCWSGECDRRLIREILSPTQQPHQQKVVTPPRKKKPQAVTKIPPLAQEKLSLVKLLSPAMDIPQPEKPRFLPKGVSNKAVETVYTYSSNQWISRFEWEDANHPKGRQKTFRQCHLDVSGILKWTKGSQPWPAYRQQEAIALSKIVLRSGHIPLLLMTEGEKVVESLRNIGLAGVTLQGSSWSKELDIFVQELQAEIPGTILVFLADNDSAGVKKAAKVMQTSQAVNLPCLVIEATSIDPNLPESGDVADILSSMNAQEFILKLEAEIYANLEQKQELSTDKPVEKNFYETAFDQLYAAKPWVCIANNLYYWNGKYYQQSPDVIELRRCAEYCASTPEFKNGKWVLSMAKPSAAQNLLKWAKARLGIDSNLINPPGLNLANGVLQINWKYSIPFWQLVPHNPAYIYTYCSEVKYDPLANPEHCLRMLSVLDLKQRDIFLKIIAASLDLKTVRKYKGRLIKALLLFGHGSNGKDTLREAVAMLYDRQGITAATISDFAAYDNGRKFPLARLSNCRVNWASENSNTTNIDNINSLKAFISGDPISIEAKGKDEYEFEPVGVALFNINDTPNLKAILEAIQSRYAVLHFNKTFKINANPAKGEIEADSRFKYDPIFIKTMVLPAFLNLLLDALVRLMKEGIDYRI